MKKNLLLSCVTLATICLMTACSSAPTETTATTAAATTVSATTATETTAVETTVAETTVAETTAAPSEVPTLRVGGLKGPTSMGLVTMADNPAYEMTMVTAADELIAKIATNDLDIALIPANVASILYQKTNGAISVIDINTLGVLYIVSSDDSIQSIDDLKGKTVYLTGKGSSPDFVINYLLTANGLTTTDDVTLEFKSEATEVASLLQADSTAIGLLPQPFVTVASMQNENLKIVLDLTKEWEAVQTDSGSQLVTGVTIVRNEILETYPDAITTFLEEHQDSAAFTAEDIDATAQFVVDLGVVPQVPIAKAAIPYCSIVCITGEEMKSALTGYLDVLFNLDPTSVGGVLPADDFYYIP